MGWIGTRDVCYFFLINFKEKNIIFSLLVSKKLGFRHYPL